MASCGVGRVADKRRKRRRRRGASRARIGGWGESPQRIRFATAREASGPEWCPGLRRSGSWRRRKRRRVADVEVGECGKLWRKARGWKGGVGRHSTAIWCGRASPWHSSSAGDVSTGCCASLNDCIISQCLATRLLRFSAVVQRGAAGISEGGARLLHGCERAWPVAAAAVQQVRTRKAPRRAT